MADKDPVCIGFRYYMGIDMKLCLAPIDSINKIYAGDFLVWEGSVTSNQRLLINKPELFGGDKKEGGIVGWISLAFGGVTQAVNSYLSTLLGANLPAYRGVVGVILEKVYLVALNPHPKPWSVEVTFIPAKSWYSATANIRTGSANPVHIIYEIITNQDWGMRHTSSEIDDAAFRAAALVAYNEGLGFSGILGSSGTIYDFISQLLNILNASFYARLDTGQFTIKMHRQDYVVGDLPSFGANNILRMESFDRAVTGEITNEVIVRYRPRGTVLDDSITDNDIAAVINEGAVIAETVQYPGVDHAATAKIMAARERQVRSSNFAQTKLIVNRDGYQLSPGAVFRMNWSWPNGVTITDVPFRVLDIDYGDMDNNEISLSAVEDVLGLPGIGYVAEPSVDWSDPVQAATAVVNRYLFEIPYFILKDLLDNYAFDNLDSMAAFLGGLFGEVTNYTKSVELWDKPSSGGSYAFRGDGSLCPTGKLTVAINQRDTAINLGSLSSNAPLITVGKYGFLDNEIIRIDSFDSSTGAAVIARGCMDTVAATHAINAVLYFAEGYVVNDVGEYAGDALDVKARTRTYNLLAEADAPTDSITLNAQRANKPYPPGKFRINTLAYPAVILQQPAVTVAHRDRTNQFTRPVIDESASSIGPEAGVTYTFRFRDGITNSIIQTYTGVSGTSQTLTVAAELAAALHGGELCQRLRVEIWAVRAGLNSYQTHDFTFERSGLGCNLGNYLGGIDSLT